MAYDQIVNLNLGFDLKPTLTVVQYDSGRLLNLYIDDFMVPQNSEVRIYVKKPSGHEIYNPCTYTDNLVVTPGTLQMFAEVGTSSALIQIITNGTYLTSFPFNITVTPNATATTHIESSDEYTILNDLITEARDIIAAEALRVEAEKARVAAEAARAEAENSRETAEQNRETAEAQRVTEFNEIKNELETIGQTVTQQGNTAEQQGNAAEQKGNTAEQQGNTAEQQGNAAKTNGDYAKEQGDYAKTQADRVIEAIDSIEINLDYQHMDTAQAYIVGTQNDGTAGIYDDDVYLTTTAGQLHVNSLVIADAVFSYNAEKAALQISFI